MVTEPRVHEFECVWVWCDKLSNLFFGQVCTVFWMPGVADFVKSVNQGILKAGFERNIDVDRGTSRGLAQPLPIGRDGNPPVLHGHWHVVPTWYEGRFKTVNGHSSDEHREHREQVMVP